MEFKKLNFVIGLMVVLTAVFVSSVAWSDSGSPVPPVPVPAPVDEESAEVAREVATLPLRL